MQQSHQLLNISYFFSLHRKSFCGQSQSNVRHVLLIKSLSVDFNSAEMSCSVKSDSLQFSQLHRLPPCKAATPIKHKFHFIPLPRKLPKIPVYQNKNFAYFTTKVCVNIVHKRLFLTLSELLFIPAKTFQENHLLSQSLHLLTLCCF